MINLPLLLLKIYQYHEVMKSIYVFLILTFLGQCLSAQEYIDLYKDRTNQEPDSKRRDGVTRITKVFNPRLQVFRPADASNNGHSVIICPGGGYQILAIDKEGTEIAEYLTNLGYTAYVLEYSVPQQQEMAFKDLFNAIQVVRTINHDRKESQLGVLGFSAGGHLAATVSTMPDSTMSESTERMLAKPDFAVLIYPAYLDKGENAGLSPEIPLTSETIPMFIFVSADDPYARSAVVMAGALQENQTSVEFHMYPEGGHGYGMRKGIEAAETWPLLLENWLKKR